MNNSYKLAQQCGDTAAMDEALRPLTSIVRREGPVYARMEEEQSGDEVMSDILKSPFPYFGGKSRIAPLVWERFGKVGNYVEPFFGSGAMLLGCPWPGHTETVNDIDALLSNFWRALAADPVAVATAADWPVNECVPAGTMIATPTGDMPVESVRSGMLVWGERDGRVVATRVIATKQSQASEFYDIGPLRVTGNHPIWTAERGYQDARLVTSGMHVAMLNSPVEPQASALCGDGASLPLSDRSGARPGSDRNLGQPGDPQGLPLQRTSLPLPVTVYNFQTDTHNYFANRILVHNCDLHARHRFLRDRRGWVEELMTDPKAYDAELAGWWVWGISQWIGSGWCPPPSVPDVRQLPHVGNAGRGVHRAAARPSHDHKQTTKDGEVYRKRPQRNGDESVQSRLHSEGPYDYFEALSVRLRRVRVCCGDWRRVLGPSVTFRHGLTAVFLDPRRPR